MAVLPLIAGVLLCVVGGAVRIKAWHASIVDACADDCAPGRIRYRDVLVAHLGGAGFNGVIPAHGGDAIKLALLKRRVREARFGLLLGSLGPPAAVEALLTSFLLVWAISTGILGAPSPGQIPLPLVGLGLAVAAGALWVLARKAPRLLSDVRRGMGALRRPNLLARGIAPWILAARLFRLAGLACFIAAVGLPVTLVGAVLVMAVHGGVGSGGAASSALRVAVLMAALPAAVGVSSIGLQTATALVGTQLAVSLTNLAISVTVLGVTLRTVSPKRLVAYCRVAARSHRARPQPQPAPAATKS